MSELTPSLPNDLPENLRGKKIVMVNHGDTLGGAAIVTFRLMQALRKRGLDVKMVVYTKSSNEPTVDTVGTRYSRGLRFCMERLWMLVRHDIPYKNLFMVSTGDFAANVDTHPWVKEADIVCLNWFNQGLLNLKGLKRLHNKGKKLVWTMHDMWAFTGVCHHAYECDHYTDKCGGCMFVDSGGDLNDVSHKVWERKMKAYAEVPMTFVAVSHWLERKARSSSLLRDKPVTTIHNAFPIESFYTSPHGEANSLTLTDTKSNLILIASARLDDPVKGLQYSIDALNKVFDTNPKVAQNTMVYLLGSMKQPELLDSLRMSHRWLGLVRDPKVLRYLYSTAKVVLSSSLYESLQGTLIEGQAGGALPVTFGGDGREDIVTHLKNGYIARYKDTDDLAAGIVWALGADVSRDELHRSVEERFAGDKIADKYIELFSTLI